MANISRRKDNQIMKFDQLIEYKKRKKEMFFFRNYTESYSEKLVPDLLLFHKKALTEVNGIVL